MKKFLVKIFPKEGEEVELVKLSSMIVFFLFLIITSTLIILDEARDTTDVIVNSLLCGFISLILLWEIIKKFKILRQGQNKIQFSIIKLFIALSKAAGSIIVGAIIISLILVLIALIGAKLFQGLESNSEYIIGAMYLVFSLFGKLFGTIFSFRGLVVFLFLVVIIILLQIRNKLKK
jgi:hypothetical protein